MPHSPFHADDISNFASGLPMIDGFGGMDIGGNLYGSRPGDGIGSNAGHGSFGLEDCFHTSSLSHDPFG